MNTERIRFDTIREVLVATLVRYENATKLSIHHTCSYGKEVNDIGCAIGCHLSAKDGALLDTYGLSIRTINRYADAKAILDATFGPGISRSDLEILQRMHDTAADVDQFRERLRHWLETGEVDWKFRTYQPVPEDQVDQDAPNIPTNWDDETPYDEDEIPY